MAIRYGIDKQHVAHPYNEILFSPKKEQSTDPGAAWRNLSNMMLSKRSHPQNTVYFMIPFM